MNELEKSTILDFASSEISADDFYDKMPQYRNEDFILENYIEVILNKDAETLNYLRLIPIENIVNYQNVYRQLLLENWHIEHEDIVGFFSRISMKILII